MSYRAPRWPKFIVATALIPLLLLGVLLVLYLLGSTGALG